MSLRQHNPQKQAEVQALQRELYKNKKAAYVSPKRKRHTHIRPGFTPEPSYRNLPPHAPT